jgi:Tol biopolymer transport system component
MWKKSIVFLWISILLLQGCTLVNGASNLHGLVYESEDVVWMLSTDQGRKNPLVRRADIGAYFALALSTDLAQVAYSTDSHDLRIANIDGNSERVVITTQLRDAGLVITRMSWSPENEKLAALATPVEDPQLDLEGMSLYVVDLSTDAIQVVATGVTGFAWTQDGKQLAVLKQFARDESSGVYLVSADGSTSRQLFEGLAEPYIVVSPNGDEIAFVTNRPGHGLEFSLFIVNLASGNTVNLLQDSELSFRSVEYPTWSPDDRSIAFIARLPADTGLTNTVLFVFDFQTRTLREVASSFHGPLAWSPDGQAIAGRVRSCIHQVNIQTGNVQKMIDDGLSTPENFRWE